VSEEPRAPVREVHEIDEDRPPSSPDGDGRKRKLVVHPLLFAAFPVLYLYAHNIQEGVSLDDLLPSLGIVVGAAAVLLAVAALVLRDLRKAGLIVSVLVLLFFSYGHVHLAVLGWRIAGVVVGRNAVLVPLWILLAGAALLVVVRTRRRLHELTSVLNVVAAGLVLLNVFSVVQYQIRSRATERAAIEQSQAGFQGHLPDPDQVLRRPPAVAGRNSRPDIYYVMLEEYGGERGLQEEFGYDNTAFLQALESRGMFVGYQTTANYPRTSLSLASSLNMEYLDFLTDELGKDSDDARPLTRLMEYNRVGRYLKSIGYRYIQIGSWWAPTRISPIADQNVVFGGLSEFDKVLYETTALQPIRRDEFRRREWKRVQFAFNAVERARTTKSPRFVFAHILVPHDPYVFYPDGRYKTREKAASMSKEQNYIQQLEYANSRVLRMVDTLLNGPESTRPVIVLQSDEGPYQGAPTAWGTIADTNLVRKFPILNAYYLPGAGHADLYPTITPVNSFRVVFRLYFGADLATLPDRNYVFRSLRRLYDFTEVTDRVRALVRD
jgi:hypothetical protein